MAYLHDACLAVYFKPKGVVQENTNAFLPRKQGKSIDLQ